MRKKQSIKAVKYSVIKTESELFVINENDTYQKDKTKVFKHEIYKHMSTAKYHSRMYNQYIRYNRTKFIKKHNLINRLNFMNL